MTTPNKHDNDQAPSKPPRHTNKKNTLSVTTTEPSDQERAAGALSLIDVAMPGPLHARLWVVQDGLEDFAIEFPRQDEHGNAIAVPPPFTPEFLELVGRFVVWPEATGDKGETAGARNPIDIPF